MFNSMFNELCNVKLLQKTDTYYMYGNAGEPIYKAYNHSREGILQGLTKAGLTIEYDEKENVNVIFFNNQFVGAIE